MLLGAGLVVAAVALRERDLVFLGVLPLALSVLAWLAVATRRPTLEADHRVEPVRLQAGEVGSLRLRLRNVGPRTTRPLDLVQPGITDLLTGVRRTVPPVPPAERTALSLPLRARRRGAYRVPSPRVTMHDPLGLARVVRVLPASAELLVLPTVLPLTGLPRGLVGRTSTGRGAPTGQPGGGDPDAGVRAYRAGDDPRTIHWRASARLLDDLVVRVAGPTTLGSAALVLDARRPAGGVGAESPVNRPDGPGAGREDSRRAAGRPAPGGPTPENAAFSPDGAAPDGLEVAVALAASIGHHLLEQDVEVDLTDHAGAAIVSGHDVADDLLAALAVVGEPPGESPWHPVVTGSPDAVVAVVGPLTASEATALAALRRGTALALVVGDAPTCVDVLRGAGWRVVTVDVTDAATPDGGAHLADAWRRLCGGAAVRGGSGWSGAGRGDGDAGGAFIGGAPAGPARRDGAGPDRRGGGARPGDPGDGGRTPRVVQVGEVPR
ncbi:hypothetical protein GCM10025875_29040 [Litorihabitans aurantiacus]|uniref:DUF58 domain-containing protein n=1 Tax=Litorihabitans aurantiacus TaxID=1930061 RepID=A0AA37XGM3_9MICO|nr:hypothetical protein GCM10025875_29040 [Litorihabitans aurantiacus]